MGWKWGLGGLQATRLVMEPNPPGSNNHGFPLDLRQKMTGRRTMKAIILPILEFIFRVP